MAAAGEPTATSNVTEGTAVDIKKSTACWEDDDEEVGDDDVAGTTNGSSVTDAVASPRGQGRNCGSGGGGSAGFNVNSSPTAELKARR